VIGIDTLAYGHLAIVPWNIIHYNIFGGSERGPDLYGTSPWNFYLLNLILNFNVLVPLSLLSLPALYITSIVDRKRLGFVKAGPDQSSPFVVLGVRLMPLYVWLGILTLQAHKEERFMFPAYPILCFNAAVALYLIRGWFEVAFIHFTKSPYKASDMVRFSIVLTNKRSAGITIVSLQQFYHLSSLWRRPHLPQPYPRSMELLSCPTNNILPP
jgi:alpha-1,2-mannosyltransferase